MIELTRLNGNKFIVNSDLIKYVEAVPDTTLTLVTGEKLLVADSCEAVVEQSLQYRAQVLRGAWPDALVCFNAKAAQEALIAARNNGDASRSKDADDAIGSSDS